MTQLQEDFEAWIKQHPHLAGGNTFTKCSRYPDEYDSSWMQSTFEAYLTLRRNLERAELINDNWQNGVLQEAAHYNWLDDENELLESTLKEAVELLKECKEGENIDIINSFLAKVNK